MCLPDIRTSRINVMIDAVNRRIPKSRADIRSKDEEMWYDAVWADAEQHQAECGFWPVYEMGEIEYDDPILDIYGDEPPRV